MVCCVNRYTEAEMVVPNTLLTALGKSVPEIGGDRADISGVLLGLTLSYRCTRSSFRITSSLTRKDIIGL
jgi:hypothetical protein